ncbi:Zn-dependent exopeptidases superfamily protein isoform X2 [Carex rostrata]
MEATLTPARTPRQLKVITLIVGIAAPVTVSAGIVFRGLGNLIGTIVRLDRNPGGAPVWLGNALVAIYISVVICLALVHLLSYIHFSGAKFPLVLSMVALLALSLGAVSMGVIPAFTDDFSRTVNAVHVVDTTGNDINAQEPLSYISLYSNTPGKLTREVESLKDEEFFCGRNNTVDFVSFTVNYGCWSYMDGKSGWTKSEIPTIQVESDSKTDVRETLVSMDTKSATRWALAINMEEIDDFRLYVGSEELVTAGNKTEIDGWHTIQFAGGKNSPTKFRMKLVWLSNPTQRVSERPHLLKLRADMLKVTARTEKILNKLPTWTSQFGKSTAPYNLAFLASLPVKF